MSGDADGRLRWWEVQSGECLQVHEAHQGLVQSLKVSPDVYRRVAAMMGSSGCGISNVARLAAGEGLIDPRSASRLPGFKA